MSFIIEGALFFATTLAISNVPVKYSWDFYNVWSDSINESDHEYQCTESNGSFSFMTGRSHEGDENGDTRYQCTSFVKADFSGKVSAGNDFSWSTELTESMHNYTCPINSWMIAREHYGDETGSTKYACAKAIFQGVPVTWDLHDIETSGIFVESNHVFSCIIGKQEPWSLVGRSHDGDENGGTVYKCAKMIVPNETNDDKN